MNTPKKYIAVPAIHRGALQCVDCVWGPLSLGACIKNWRAHGLGGVGAMPCIPPPDARIAIEDTPEGRAAYVAAKLEG